MPKLETSSDAVGGEHWSYRREGAVGIWEIHDWGRLFEEELADAEDHYSTVADGDDIVGSVVVFDSVDALSAEMQSYITEAWSGLAQDVDGIERTAYVADGITAMAVKSNVTAPDTELESFDSLEEGIAWVSEVAESS